MGAFLDTSRVWKVTKLVNAASMDKSTEALVNFATKAGSMSSMLFDILLTPPRCDQNIVMM